MKGINVIKIQHTMCKNKYDNPPLFCWEKNVIITSGLNEVLK